MRENNSADVGLILGLKVRMEHQTESTHVEIVIQFNECTHLYCGELLVCGGISLLKGSSDL